MSGNLSLILDRVRESTVNGKYLHWDELLRRPTPGGLTHEQWWLGLKLHRRGQLALVPLEDPRGRAFRVGMPDVVQTQVHEIARFASGNVRIPDSISDPDLRKELMARSLMEEGITSSIIEGAATTRQKARELFHTGRAPRTRGEQMILNNHAAMQFIVGLGGESLTPEAVCDLHETVTAKTLDDPEAAGRLRDPNEPVDFVGLYDEVIHTPPPAEQLPERLAAMCDFANGVTPAGFIHPVVRSIVLHFWLAHDHPFVDGNGRCARALFYWSMLHHGYWLCQYVSISEVILRGPIRYARPFLHSETDENDLTYFLLHQLGVVGTALADLHRHVARTRTVHRELEARFLRKADLNRRQISLIAHALDHPHTRYHIKQHMLAEGVVYQTARTDLLGLAQKGLFRQRKIGRKWYFHPVPNLEAIVTGGQKDGISPE